ncbi:MAG: PAS domain S-box protein [Actinobacteria bacterium]|nr:PAS domain S-box protein [Actinomycetota bacterium]
MDMKADTKGPAAEKSRILIRVVIFIFVVVLMGNLGALVDAVTHPDIEYFDEEHIIVGGITALIAAVLFGAMALYARRLEKTVSKLRRIEIASNESEKKYRDLFEKSKDVIFISTPAGFFTDINPAGVKLFGFNSREEMLHIKTSDLYPREEDRETQRRALEESGFLKDQEIIMRRKDGTEVIVTVTAEVVKDENGGVTAFHGTIHDITEQKHMEQQLLQSQKMDSVGRLAGGIAHDYNNYLTTIQGYIDLAINEHAEDSVLVNNLREARAASESAADLTSQLLLFSRHQPVNMRPVNLNKTVRGVEGMIKRLIGDNVTLVESLSDDLKMVHGDMGTLSQAIVNLALNSGSYIQDGGEITITTCNGVVGPEYMSDHPEARAGEFVTLSVSDSGQGMDSLTLAHVFEPFYAAKGGKTEGLGLSAVYGIIMHHDGWIDVDSIPGMGTTFTIFLPASAIEETAEETFDSGTDDYSSLGERILLVEDDDAVRHITEKMLRESGYEVIGAHDAAEAFARFASEKGDFQLVLSDIVLPGENGLTLVENLKSHKPELAVLLSSGYADTAVDWSVVQSRGYRFLQKPYVMPELLRAVRELLTNTS